MYCKNHPSVETRVTCSDCGKPICPDCMVFTAVAAKCADCARMPRSSLVRVKPERKVLTVVAGVFAAVVGGIAFRLLVGAIGMLAFLIAFAMGMAVGEAISWASGRHHSTRLAAWAAGCAAAGVLLPYVIAGVGLHGPSPDAIMFAVAYGGLWKLIWMAAAAFAAWQRNV